MSSFNGTSKRQNSARSRRVGQVTIYARGTTWYIYYFENGQRVRRSVGHHLDEAKQLAAQINAQLATGTPAMLSFEPLTLSQLRQRWLEHHEHVLRSSVATIARYRSATEHLIRFSSQAFNARPADRFLLADAEAFVKYLREIRVAPNGHPNASRVRLRDKGILFILETCRALFNYAARHRHLPPYHDNPFAQLRLDRLRIEDAKPIELFPPDQEERFMAVCDDWQFPIFLTLALTGLRPGELTHLMLPDDVDLDQGLLLIQNKPDLGWQTKTRNQRMIPLIERLRDVLAVRIGDRQTGPVFLRRRFVMGSDVPILAKLNRKQLMAELERRRVPSDEEWTRTDDARVACRLWQDAGAIKTDRLRVEFMKITRKAGMPEATCPKIWRHMFATTLQDANVDPLIRQELMGHSIHSLNNNRNGNGLGTTSLYTHTKDETRRTQLQSALQLRQAALRAAETWLKCNPTRSR